MSRAAGGKVAGRRGRFDPPKRGPEGSMRSISFEPTRRNFTQLRGQTVIACRYHAVEATFELISRHWDTFGGNESAFLRLLFHGVDTFKRSPGDLKLPGRAWFERYSSRDVPGTLAIEEVGTRVESHNGAPRHHVSLNFGSSHGRCDFNYKRLEAWVRPVMVDAPGGADERFDATTGTPVDYYEPFESLSDNESGLGPSRRGPWRLARRPRPPPRRDVRARTLRRAGARAPAALRARQRRRGPRRRPGLTPGARGRAPFDQKAPEPNRVRPWVTPPNLTRPRVT